MSERRIKVRWRTETDWKTTFTPDEAADQFGTIALQDIALRSAQKPGLLAELEADEAEGQGATSRIEVTAAEAVKEDGVVWLYVDGDPPGERRGPFPSYDAALDYWTEED